MIPGSSSATCRRSGTRGAPDRRAGGPPPTAISSTTSPTKRVAGRVCATAGQNVGTTIGLSRTPAGTSSSCRRVTSGGPSRPDASTRPNLRGIRSRPGPFRAGRGMMGGCHLPPTPTCTATTTACCGRTAGVPRRTRPGTCWRACAPDARVLDVGCGPGTITADLAARVPDGQVTGHRRGRRRAGAGPAGSGAAGSGQRPVRRRGRVPPGLRATATFDVVHAHQVLQHLSDPVAALTEMRRVSRPGGLVAARDGDYGGFFWFPEDPGADRMAGAVPATWPGRSAASRTPAGACCPGPGRPASPRSRPRPVPGVTPGTRTGRGGASSWAERLTESPFGDRAVEHGLATRQDLARLAAGLAAVGGQRGRLVLHPARRDPLRGACLGGRAASAARTRGCGGQGVEDDADRGLAVAAPAADGEDLAGHRLGRPEQPQLQPDLRGQAAGGQRGDQGDAGARGDQAEQDSEVGGAGDHAGHEPGPGAGPLDQFGAAGGVPRRQERQAGQGGQRDRGAVSPGGNPAGTVASAASG